MDNDAQSRSHDPKSKPVVANQAAVVAAKMEEEMMDNRNCKTCNSYAMSQKHDDHIIKTTGHHPFCRKFSAELLCNAYEARINQLESGYDELRKINNKLLAKLATEKARTKAEVPEIASQAMDIAELQAELGRVKSESLCVVPVGEECAVGFWCSLREQKFICEGRLLERFGEHNYGKGKGVAVLDLNGEDSVIADEDTLCRPVRLEPWEES